MENPPRPANTAAALPFSPRQVLERVRHRFVQENGDFLAAGDTYQLRMAKWTLSFELSGGAALRVRFDRARLGGRPVELGQAAVCPGVRANLLTLDRQLVTETLEARALEVEQSWTLRAPLSEDLSLFGAVDGMAYSGSGPEGLRFEDRRTGERVRYGHTTVRDARGASLQVASRFEAGSIEIAVPGSFLRAAAYPVVIDPTISAESGTGSSVYGAAAGNQSGAAVSFDGTNYLVAWRDSRAGSAQIWAARVSQTGTVLDPDGFLVSTVAGFMADPVASVFDGTNHFLVWSNFGGMGSSEILAARVTPSKAVLDSPPIAVTNVGASFRYQPSAAMLAGNLFVAWTDLRNGSPDVYGGRLTPSGVRQDGNGFGISLVAGSAQQLPAVAVDSAANLALVVWQDARNSATTGLDVYGARVNSSGIVLDPTGVVISNAGLEQSTPTAAVSSSGRWLVAWTDARSGGGQTDIYGARAEVVSGNLSLLDASGFAINTAANSQREPHAFSDGTGFLVVWADTRPGGGGLTDLWAARPQANGAVLPDSTTGFSVSLAANAQQGAALAFDGTNFLVAWTDARNAATSADIYAARVPKSGTAVLDPVGFPVSTGPNSQMAPSVASDGTGYLVVWADSRNGATGLDIYGTRVDRTGSVVDPNGILINNNSAEQADPAVAFTGGAYLVVWRDARMGAANYDVYGARVSPAGTVLDSASVGVGIGTGALSQLAPAVAGNGTRFLVTWQIGGATPDIGAARVSSLGVVEPGSPFVVSAAANAQTAPSLASDGADWLVAWQDTRNGPGNSDIYAQRVSNGGGLLGGALALSTPSASNQTLPAVAFGGGTFLVAWQDGRDTTTQPDIFAARVSTTGTLTDGPAASGGISVDRDVLGQVAPAAGFDGADFVVVWDDNRLGAGEYDVYGMRVSPASGALVDSAKFAVSAGSNLDRFPAIAHGPGGQMLIVYQSVRAGVTRAYVRRYAPCTVASCNDSNVCTDDACDLNGGACAYTNNTSACPDDGNNCTNDICGGGACNHPAKPGCCNGNSDCADGNVCTSDLCSGPGGNCSNPAIASCCNTNSDCNDSNACTSDVCSGPGGSCSNSAIAGCCNTNSDCNDSNACTSDACSGNGGVCSNSQVAGCCNGNSDCDDGNLCTTDSCSGPGGSCSNTRIANCCALPADCDDGNGCTTDSCSSNVCSHPVVPGCCNLAADCDDGNACTLDSCSGPAGSCSSSAIQGCCLTSGDCPLGQECVSNVCGSADAGLDGGDSDAGSGTDGGTCGPSPCGACQSGCAPLDSCDNGTWACDCSCSPDAGDGAGDGGTGTTEDVAVGKSGCGCSAGADLSLLATLALAAAWRRRRGR